jgi:hypothetical protein
MYLKYFNKSKENIQALESFSMYKDTISLL